MRFSLTPAWVFLIFAFLQPFTQVYANHAGIESAIQNLQYALTVEWDQSSENSGVRDRAIVAQGR